MEMLGFKTKTYSHQISLPNSIYCVWVRKIKVFYIHDIFLGRENHICFHNNVFFWRKCWTVSSQFTVIVFWLQKNEPYFVTTVQYCRILLIIRKTNIDGSFLRWRCTCIVVMQRTDFADTSTYYVHIYIAARSNIHKLHFLSWKFWCYLELPLF